MRECTITLDLHRGMCSFLIQFDKEMPHQNKSGIGGMITHLLPPLPHVSTTMKFVGFSRAQVREVVYFFGN